jgi:hypothetical protein
LRTLQQLRELGAVMAEFHELPVASFTDDQVLALWRDVEVGRRQLAPVDHVLVQEVPSRHLASARGARSMTMLARDALRVSAVEARSRVAAVDAMAPRRSFTGEALAPIYPQVAAAQAQILDVDALRQVAHRLALTLDPDGLLKDVEYRRSRRGGCLLCGFHHRGFEKWAGPCA